MIEDPLGRRRRTDDADFGLQHRSILASRRVPGEDENPAAHLERVVSRILRAADCLENAARAEVVDELAGDQRTWRLEQAFGPFPAQITGETSNNENWTEYVSF